jgi:hypothetical protein
MARLQFHPILPERLEHKGASERPNILPPFTYEQTSIEIFDGISADTADRYALGASR